MLNAHRSGDNPGESCLILGDGDAVTEDFEGLVLVYCRYYYAETRIRIGNCS